MGRATWRLGVGGLRALIAVALAGGCSRPALDTLCPSLEPGDLVVSEVRGTQPKADPWGQWIEIYNRRSEPVPLNALRVSVLRLNSAEYGSFVVRDRALQVEAHGYVVFGNFLPENRPGHVNYAYRTGSEQDFDLRGTDSAIIDLWSCRVHVDRATFQVPVETISDMGVHEVVPKFGVPSSGTLALDGARDPDAADNDTYDHWCADDRPAGVDGGTPIPDGGAFFGTPGTPGARNIACH